MPPNNEGIDSYVQVCMTGNWFETLLANHKKDYSIERILQFLVHKKHSSSVPR